MRFAASERATLGVEWELSLVDPSSRELVPAADEVIARVDDPRVKGEFITSIVELVTGVHDSASDAVAELRALRDAVAAAADDLGLALVGAGTHPFSRWRDQRLRPSARYRRLVDIAGPWAERLMIVGVHDHVGLDRPREQLVPAMQALVTHLPLVLALSASSPFWQGEDSGYASQRSMLFQQIPNAGVPPQLRDWDEWCLVAEQAVAMDAVRDVAELRWDVRPSPGFGTIESRIPDGAPSLDDVEAVTALTHCIVEQRLRDVDAGIEREPVADWIVREHKWRAARHGLDAELRTADGGSTTARDALLLLLDELGDVADDLGASHGLELARRIVHAGGPAEAQRRVEADAGMQAVVDHLVAEARR